MYAYIYEIVLYTAIYLIRASLSCHVFYVEPLQLHTTKLKCQNFLGLSLHLSHFPLIL